MNIKSYISSLLSFMLIASSGCAPKKPEAAEQREKWLTSLNDSIAMYQNKLQTVNDSLQEARKRVGEIIGNFEYVNNPREVEGYYILNGWKNRYPLNQTGLVARVTEDERFELIATLTGAHFNEIGVTAGGMTVQSEVVPHDQALNYRANSLNTVCFTGPKADSIGALIASNESGRISVTYLNGSRTGSFKLPDNEKSMIAATWHLYHRQSSVHSLEKELPRLSGKIAACRRMLEEADSSINKGQ